MDTPDPMFDHRDAPLAQAVLMALVERWSEGLTFGPDHIGRVPGLQEDRDFIRSIQFLNDHGFITIEALLVGAGPRPAAVDVFITRRGRRLLTILTAVDPSRQR